MLHARQMARRKPAPERGSGRPVAAHRQSFSWLLHRLFADGRAWVEDELALSRSEAQDMLRRCALGLGLAVLCHAVLLAGLVVFVEGVAAGLGAWLQSVPAAHVSLGLLLLALAVVLGLWAWQVIRPSRQLRSRILRWLLASGPAKESGHD